ncbi:MAG: AraC family transcriptional regulator [Sphingomonas sp.]|nr:AraC family transcriptional regulator [Sphingomonas sp.]
MVGHGRGNAGRARIDVPELIYMPATGPLMPLVESYYLYRYDAKVIDGVERVDTGQIRFMLKGEGEMTFSSGHREASLPVMVNGPGAAAARYRVAGPFHCFGVSLRPIGWRSLIQIPANRVSETALDADSIFDNEATPLLAPLRNAQSLEEMVAIVEPMLLRHRHRVPEAHLALCRAVREWGASEALGVEALYAMVPMSQRQATRLCNEYFGGPPKLLERKFRAIRAAMRIYQGAPPAVAAAPFFDQSHMIHEVKHFTGHTPTSLREAIDPVLASTLDNETFHILPEVFPESVDPGGS